MPPDYREKTVRFGAASLFGILTEPPAGPPATGRAVILRNSGLLHRVGPSRLHVQVARRLAPHGFSALRFDFSGIGDSEARRDGLAFEQSAVLEVKDAMDYLASAKGVKEFTLWGLCSGADAAFLSAVADPRVTGVIQLDAWIYHTWRYKVRRYAPRLVNFKSWKNLLTGKTYVGPYLRRLARRRSTPETEPGNENLAVSHYARAFPPKAKVEEMLRTLLERRVRLLYLFSGGQAEHINYANQFWDCFSSLDAGALVTVKYDPTADHIFSGLAHQELVVASTVAWALASTTPVATKSLVTA
ncbi:MAG: hypothetical protein HOP28_07845 [Gemmatimonadales bacterium]|nr:hypothetical protein [Gemmatimonadales bacterium]